MELKEKVFITKMSVKNLNCKPGTVNTDGAEDPYRLCIVMGTATGVKMKEEEDGRISSALLGNFEGINIRTGEVFVSGKLYLPGGIHETVEAAVVSKDNEGKITIRDVEFSLELRSVKAPNPIGYSYQAVSLLKPREADPMENLRKLALDRLAIAGSSATPAAIAATAAPKKK